MRVSCIGRSADPRCGLRGSGFWLCILYLLASDFWDELDSLYYDQRSPRVPSLTFSATLRSGSGPTDDGQRKQHATHDTPAMSDLRRQDSSASTMRRRRNAPELTRVSSSNSYAGNSLRRMATHETGEYAVRDTDVVGLDTHDEHDHEHDHEHQRGDDDRWYDGYGAKARDEEAALESSGDEHPSAVARARADNDAVQTEEGDGTPPGSSDSDKSDSPTAKGKGKFELTDQTNLLPVKQVMLIFAGLNCALFCSLLDQTIVATALPTLGKIFNSASIASWVGTAYMLTSTALQPVYGRLSDIFGRKNVLLGSLIIFLFGSLACALAQTMIQLIIFRAFQGLGGGGILTLAMIISESSCGATPGWKARA